METSALYEDRALHCWHWIWDNLGYLQIKCGAVGSWKCLTQPLSWSIRLLLLTISTYSSKDWYCDGYFTTVAYQLVAWIHLLPGLHTSVWLDSGQPLEHHVARLVTFCVHVPYSSFSLEKSYIRLREFGLWLREKIYSNDIFYRKLSFALLTLVLCSLLYSSIKFSIKRSLCSYRCDTRLQIQLCLPMDKEWNLKVMVASYACLKVSSVKISRTCFWLNMPLTVKWVKSDLLHQPFKKLAQKGLATNFRKTGSVCITYAFGFWYNDLKSRMYHFKLQVLVYTAAPSYIFSHTYTHNIHTHIHT